MLMRVAGVGEDKGSKAMTMATRVAGEQMATVTTRAMLTKTKEADEEEGHGKGGKGGKSNGNS